MAGITSSELNAFLDDVRANINEPSDFRKVFVYLLQFLVQQLEDPADEMLLKKLYDTIDLVLSKKKFVVNIHIMPAELKQIAGTSSHTSSKPLFFEWLIETNLNYLPACPNGAISHIKTSIMSVIGLVVGVDAYKYQLRQSLVGRLSASVDVLFTNQSSGDADQLFQTVHLLTIVNDYEIRRKLLLANFNFDLLLRKLWFVVVAKHSSAFTENLKCTLITHQTTNVILNETSTIQDVNLLVEWITASLPYAGEFMASAQAIASCLLKLTKWFSENDSLQAFANLLNTHNTLSVDSNHGTLPQIITDALKIVCDPLDASVSFANHELNELLTGIRHTNTLDVFDFCGYKQHYKLETRADLNQFFNSIIKALQDPDFAPDLASLYTFVTSIGNLPYYLSDDYDDDSISYKVSGTVPMEKNIYALVSPDRPPVSENPIIQSYVKDVIIHFLLTHRIKLIDANPLLATNVLLSIFKLFASYLPSVPASTSDPIFKFVLYNLMTNGNREVRLAASRILPLYIIGPKDNALESTFKLIFSNISSINFSNPSKTHLAESTIKAYGDLAVVCDGEWLCVIFIKLIDLLGESNEHHVNLVYTCLLNIANSKCLSPYRMLSPFLPSISERIIRNSRIFAKLLELLGVSRKFFLNRTREYTTPRFLEYYKHDFIQDIADANNSSKNKLILKQLSRILATYLCRGETINEKYILNVLGNASPELKGLSMGDLISSIGEITWYVLLNIQYDDQTDTIVNKTKTFTSLEYISHFNMKRSPPNRKSVRNFGQMDHVQYLLGEHVLELVQKFSENIYQTSKPFLDKVASIRAVEFLIKTNIEAASSALGQISTCLQSTIENPNLEYFGMKCLNVLVHSLNTERLISLFDIVIALIFQRFNYLEKRSKLIGVEILKKLFIELRDNWSDHTLYYFSVPFIPHLDEYYQLDPSFINVVRPKARNEYFPEFTRRLKTRNKYVVKQSLDDLMNYTTKYQDVCQLDDFRDPTLEPHISDLIRTLLDTSHSFKSEDEDITTSCSKVLCIIGALDRNKFNRRTIKTQMVIMHDFQNYRENAEFLKDFIENQLVTEFWASNDPIKQLYYSYAMQNILEILRLDTSVLSPTTSNISTDLWGRFSDIAKSTLTPFLCSKYFCALPKYNPVIYPVYKLGATYEGWLITLASDLLKRPLNNSSEIDPTKRALFHTFATLIRDQDVSICHHILKYAVLSHIIAEEVATKRDIATEFTFILETESASSSPEAAENLKLCNQIIFEVIDYLYAWVSSAKRSAGEAQVSESERGRLENGIDQVNEFLSGIQPELIAVRSAECDSYERTILYLEKCYRDGKVDENNMMGDFNVGETLQSMYSDINDMDALTGVLRKFSNQSLSQKLNSFQYNENWSIAQEAFHILGESIKGDEGSSYQTKLLKSLNEQALYDEVLTNVSSKIDIGDIRSIPLEWATLGLQAAIMTGESEKVEKWFALTESLGNPQDVESLISFKVAEGLLDLYDKNFDGFNATFENLHKIIGSSLLPSASSSFRNSNLLTQLHIMFDMRLLLSDADKLVDEASELTVNRRLDNVDNSFESKWKILSMHKVASLIRGNLSKTSEVHLICSEIARKNKRFDVATSNIMRAMVLGDDKANFEYAKLLWDQGKESEAIKSLEKILQVNSFSNSREQASYQLLYAEWIDESNHSSSSVIIEEYNKAYKLEAKWEKPYYLLGRYYDKLKASSDDSSGFYEAQIIRLFLKALSLGPTYIFEALPKLLTIWLDFSQQANKTKEADRKLQQILIDLESCCDGIPVYVWYTSITQLISRIGHNHEPSVKMIAKIIKTVIEAYPKHSLWFILSHMASNDETRRTRTGEILSELQASKGLNAIITGALELFKTLTRLASVKVRRGTKRMSLCNDFDIVNLAKKYDCLVIPVRSNLDIKLPSHNHLKKVSRAFPKASSVTFDGVDDTVNIFHSLQMPRQITVRGSDNIVYRLMVKKDDTRKDAKVVELTTMINKLLSANNEARKRNLSIPNYSVVPLAENMGVIEFVQDVTTMKSIIHDEKKRLGQPMNDRRLFLKLDEAQKVVKSKSLANQQKAKSDLLKLFEKILKSLPPVLHNWYINQFADPASWYLARTAFTRSSAVMSIVGYIIGLGDRHCENILFFKKNGRILHIDFDCLFEKGSTLPTPEIVPFRLTQNMIDAMGISGVEGTFRITCEVTSGLVRENEASLMNILETLLYDPLLDWRNQQNPHEHLKKVRRKIRGLIDEKEGLPMNVHGQVDTLIQQASSNERLSQMYGGWAPYL